MLFIFNILAEWTLQVIGIRISQIGFQFVDSKSESNEGISKFFDVNIVQVFFKAQIFLERRVPLISLATYITARPVLQITVNQSLFEVTQKQFFITYPSVEPDISEAILKQAVPNFVGPAILSRD